MEVNTLFHTGQVLRNTLVPTMQTAARSCRNGDILHTQRCCVLRP